ncbi:MAG: endonuclease/exonuclease/phosphatase family protein [Janthinobacterium lividum]
MPGWMRVGAFAAVLVLGGGPARAADPIGIKIATWNMEWLTSRPAGDPALPDDAEPKQDADIATLAGYATGLQATAVALEEVDDPALVARIFSPDRYQVLITNDQVVQRVALVVRRGITVTRHPDLAALDVSQAGRRHLRTGLDATLAVGGTSLRVLAVHLKSGCWEGPLGDTHRAACADLAAQLPVLQAWIAARQAEGVAFIVLGDFNRRLKAGDMFLAGLQRNAPLGVATAGHASPCWGGEDFIDQILAGGPARLWMQPDSLRVLVYRETNPDMKERLSDHCPVSVRFSLPQG